MHIRSIRTLLFALVVLCMSALSFPQVGVMITIAPPPLPVYEQPICPGDGYIWTPGYWAYGDDFDDYYWVPGTWVLAPEVGFFWTPGYWGWGGDRFVFYDGYWGPQIGFYGGINYGFGYFGEGYEGGRWDNGRFFYNRAVNNVNVTEIHNVYNTTVVNRTTVNHVSYNGGDGGIRVRPTPQQEAVARARHIPPVAAQTQHVQQARNNPQQRASVNMARPAVAATPKPGVFKERGVVAARAAGAPYTPPANRGRNQAQPGNNPGNNAARGGNPSPPENRPEISSGRSAARPSAPVHVRELPLPERPAAVNTGNSKQDKKYQQQQEKQYAKQAQERQKLAQRQEKEDQKFAKQNADHARQQQVEQRHQQQTQQLLQRHQQQQQQMQQRMQPPPPRQPAPPRERSKPSR
jgi:hypothetical protein